MKQKFSKDLRWTTNQIDLFRTVWLVLLTSLSRTL